MTTPHQPLPTTLETLLGVGAFQIGGSGTNFGQTIDEDFVNTLVKLPYATLSNMLEILEQALLKLPIEALQAFSSIVPDWLDEEITDVAEAVDKIIAALTAKDIPLAVAEFEAWVKDLVESITGIADGGLPDITSFFDDLPFIGDLMDALEGITDPGTGQLGAIFDRFQHLDAAGLFDASSLGNIANIPAIAQSKITDLVTDLGDLDTKIQDLIDTILEALTGSPVVGGPLADVLTELSDLFDTATGAQSDASDALGNVTDLAGDLLSTPSTVIGNLTNNVIDSVGTTTQGFFNALKDAFDGLGSSGATAAQVATAAETTVVTQGVAIAQAQDSAITLANLANAPKNVPYWVSPNPFEDVAYPRSQIVKTLAADLGPNSIEGNTTTDDAGGSGTHNHSDGTLEVRIDSTMYTDLIVSLAAGQLGLIAINTTDNRIYNTIGFITNGATPPTTVYAGIYSVDPSTGLYTLEHNLGNISASISTGSGLVDTRVTMASDLVAAAGSRWALGLLPISTALVLAGVRKSTISVPSGVYPAYATATLAGQSSLPSTTSAASVSDGTYRLWGCLGQAIAEDTTPLTIVETLNTANTTNWAPASWNSFNNGSSRVGIQSNQAYEVSPFAFSTSYMSSRLYKTPLHLNNHAAEITIGSGWDSGAYGNVTDRAYVRCRNNGSLGVAMHVDDNGGAARVRIATVTNLNSIGTVRATSSGSVTAGVGDKFRIEAVGDVYTCYKNGVAIAGATWTDTGGAVIPQNGNFRSVGFGTGARRNSIAGEDEAAHIDYFTAYDLP